jgi:hypothetical protein
MYMFSFSMFTSMDYNLFVNSFTMLIAQACLSPSCILWWKTFIKQSYFELFSLRAHHKVHLKHFSHPPKIECVHVEHAQNDHKETQKPWSPSPCNLSFHRHHPKWLCSNKKNLPKFMFENIMCILNFHMWKLPP